MSSTPITEDENGLEDQSICQRAFKSCLNSKEKKYFPSSSDPSFEQMIKILVVGPGDSGKSTILKQMRVIHDKNYSNEECRRYKPVIIQNILDSAIRLVEAMDIFNINFDEKDNSANYDMIQRCYERLKSGDINDWNQNSDDYCRAIKSIWQDKSIKYCFEKRNAFYLMDSTEYFMTNLERICTIQYVPILDDILRVRQPTTAIQEYTFKISGSYFLFVDVGGQRSERRKWINCFENVTCLLFVASLSDYDLKMSREELRSSNSNEDEEVNRMRDGLDLFKTLINWKKKVYHQTTRNSQKQESTEVLIFGNCSIVLFLNKEDLFEEKIRRSSLKQCFKDYQETNSTEQAKQFIAHKFVEADDTLRTSSQGRDIYWHYTFALDKKCIETVVASVRERILTKIILGFRNQAALNILKMKRLKHQINLRFYISSCRSSRACCAGLRGK